MKHPHPKKDTEVSSSIRDTLDLDSLLHPANAFGHPMDVVRDDDLTLNEKRAILASWASDACAVEAAPWDDIMDALRVLDKECYGKPLPHYKRVLARKGMVS